MQIAVIGGGINGVITAWECAKIGHSITLFEQNRLMSATSQASTKLLHGGLRYLEHGEISLVRESLFERSWWLHEVPNIAQPIEIVFPIYRDSLRHRWKIKLGMVLYDGLAGRLGIGNHRWLNSGEVLQLIPGLKGKGLQGGYLFYDGQMDDYSLGCWAAEQAQSAGVKMYEHSRVDRIAADGIVEVQGIVRKYDRVINVAGPWAVELLRISGLPHKHELDLVRGSHLLLDKSSTCGVMLQVRGDKRICFVLPYQGKTLLGTTEVRQSLNEPIVCSDSEAEYLMNTYNSYFDSAITQTDVSSSFAGVRPLILSQNDPGKATREYAIEQYGQLISVFGGKWTTSRALAIKVVSKLQ